MSESKHNSPDDSTNSERQVVDPFSMVAQIKTRGPAPVHLWDPPFCGDIDMQIRRDGSWIHEGRPIRRHAMVCLFASILKKEGDDYFLVTPVEKVGIQVEDCPFVMVEMEVENPGPGQSIKLSSNTGDQVTIDNEHPIMLDTDKASDEPHPRILVRDGLYGLINRAVFYRLVELMEAEQGEQGTVHGLRSAGEFFPLVAN